MKGLSTLKSKLPPELEDFADQIGNFIEYFGFKSVHGRIWAHLYLAAEPLDAQALMKRLKVSKALISISLSQLRQFEVIQEVGKSRENTQLFHANPDVVGVILGVLRVRERKMLSQIHSSYRLLKRLSSPDRESVGMDANKLEQVGKMIEVAETALESIVQLKSIELEELVGFFQP